MKLADFGLARSTMASDGKEFRAAEFTNNVVTMWYKSPELLLGSVKYSYPVDIWSAGCVVAELELGRPLFPGKNELEQLDLIFRALGTPSEDSWSGMGSLPEAKSLLPSLQKYTSTLVESLRSRISEPMLKLLERILIADPAKRISANGCIDSSYFVGMIDREHDIYQCGSIQLHGDLHEFQTKQQRREIERLSKQNSAQTTSRPVEGEKVEAKAVPVEDDLSSFVVPDIEFPQKKMQKK